MISKDAIFGFNNEYRFLSNFYPSTISFCGHSYPAAEHFYQSCKTLDSSQQELIRDAKNAKEARQIGKKISIRDDWEDIKLIVMSVVVRAKFKQNKSLRQKLIATGTLKLIEANWWNDRFWGTDLKGNGENNLGKILEQVRCEWQFIYSLKEK